MFMFASYIRFQKCTACRRLQCEWKTMHFPGRRGKTRIQVFPCERPNAQSVAGTGAARADIHEARPALGVVLGDVVTGNN